MRQQLEQLSHVAESELTQATTLTDLEQVRIRFLGRKGTLTQLLRGLSSVDPAERPLIGDLANRIKESFNQAHAARLETLQQQELETSLRREAVDVTLPGRDRLPGGIHPLTRAVEEISGFFRHAGFVTATGPEVESDWHNFEALNIPADHPARDMHDTFYLPPGPDGRRRVLRTHTSPVQIRFMEGRQPPLRVIAPGRVYRCDSDITHTPMFHQVEGFMVDKGVSFGHLKGLLEAFLRHFFARDLPVRFRPSFFPFTEPSAEVDMGCIFCQARGCRICKGSGWIEVLGCGMIHPVVLKNVGIDREVYSGFAFGLGVERMAMLKYRIDDLRTLFDNDTRFLRLHATV
ncbi:MAG: phenylalanine--tRNA ligase subunit alpha [Magnetococcales bacterium]|nr:phenylalanine--tRNA ligase subunit alpha [Magnetococcales bacterium]